MSQYRDFETMQAQPADQWARGESKRGCLFYGLIGCAITLLLCLIFGIVMAVLVYRFGKQFATDIAVTALNAVVEDSELPGAEKQEIKTEVQKVASDFKEGKLSTQQVMEIFRGVMQGSIGPYIMCRSLEAAYLDKSGLSADEKTVAKRTLNRMMRGVAEHKISAEQLQTLSGDITVEGPEGSRKLKQSLTDDELRTFLEKCKKLADEKQIPDDEFKVEIAKELRRVIEAVRKGELVVPEEGAAMQDESENVEEDKPTETLEPNELTEPSDGTTAEKDASGP